MGSENSSSRGRFPKWSIAAAAVLLAAAVGFGVANHFASARAADIEAQAASDAEAAAAKASEAEAAASLEPEEAARIVSSAEADGAAVAAIQNEYVDEQAAYDEATSAEGLDDAGRNALIEKRVGDLEAIASKMDAHLAADAAGARVPWCVLGKWEFASVYSFEGVRLNVVWLCRDAEGSILAICTGVYDADARVFGALKRDLTAKGASAVGATDSTASSYADSVMSLSERIAEVAPKPTEVDEEAAAALDARGAARDAYRRQYEAGEVDDGRVEPSEDEYVSSDVGRGPGVDAIEHGTIDGLSDEEALAQLMGEGLSEEEAREVLADRNGS